MHHRSYILLFNYKIKLTKADLAPLAHVKSNYFNQYCLEINLIFLITHLTKQQAFFIIRTSCRSWGFQLKLFQTFTFKQHSRLYIIYRCANEETKNNYQLTGVNKKIRQKKIRKRTKKKQDKKKNGEDKKDTSQI